MLFCLVRHDVLENFQIKRFFFTKNCLSLPMFFMNSSNVLLEQVCCWSSDKHCSGKTMQSFPCAEAQMKKKAWIQRQKSVSVLQLKLFTHQKQQHKLSAFLESLKVSIIMLFFLLVVAHFYFACFLLSLDVSNVYCGTLGLG